VRLEELGQMKKKNNDLVGNRISDIAACSIVSQPALTMKNIFGIESRTGMRNVQAKLCLFVQETEMNKRDIQNIDRRKCSKATR
jgi:hypothetical protein